MVCLIEIMCHIRKLHSIKPLLINILRIDIEMLEDKECLVAFLNDKIDVHTPYLLVEPPTPASLRIELENAVSKHSKLMRMARLAFTTQTTTRTLLSKIHLFESKLKWQTPIRKI